MKNIFRDIQGFTLVEMAIVLVIVGLLVGLGTSMIGPMMGLSKTRETKEFVGAAVESVNSWAASNNRLPDVTSAAASPTFFLNVAKTSKDAWGRDLVYLYDSAFATAPFTKDTICGRRSTRITLQTIDPAATIQNVAFVIISHGEDPSTVAPGTFTTLDGAPLTLSAALQQPPNPRAIVVPAGTDDIVRWVTLDELRSKIGCQGAQLKIVNNELPPATVGAQYPNATAGAVLAFTTDGGATPGTLRWCLEAPTATPLPVGLAFTPAMAGAIRVAPNTCNAANPLAETSWISSPTFTISGTPAANSQGAYSFTIFVRDNNDSAPAPAGTNDNITSKAFVLTVNPQ